MINVIGTLSIGLLTLTTAIVIRNQIDRIYKIKEIEKRIRGIRCRLKKLKNTRKAK